VLILAGLVDPPALRSLDSVHLATAVAIREAIGCFITYDKELANAARAINLPVAAPV
jgi:uncharacterized protein